MYISFSTKELAPKGNMRKLLPVALKPDEYAHYALQYALEQVKHIDDPSKAAKEFKSKANEFMEALVKQEM
ncbi:hypothetical protein [Nitratiruptor sp. SB155-2]|uniref:hypothetical protein n=1 Tax=Nitratiruptor sp. (strain SB155-2) TaxID=387092 RepID=UPI0002FC6276|nr:hypothetical protein [Nitratiruptor sp. SB155-2]